MFRRSHCLALLAAPIVALGCSHALERVQGVRVSHTEFRGEIWSEAMASARVVAQDGAQSFAVPGGSLWTFGDTFLGTVDSDGDRLVTGSVGTSIAILASGEAAFPPALDYWTDGAGEAAMPLVLGPGESSPEHRFWPLGGVSANGRCYLFYSLIGRTEGEGPWNFRGIGDGLARSDTPLGPYERVRRGASEEWRYPVAPSQILEADGWLWLCEVRDGAALLARVRPEEIEDPGAYEFWTGNETNYSRSRDDARPVADNVYGQVSVAWCEYLSRYLMATSSDFGAPKVIRLRMGRHPWGPWGRPFAEIAVPERPGKTTTLIYGTRLHPELFEDGGRRIVLTFCRMLEGTWELTNPEMVRVTLERTRGEP